MKATDCILEVSKLVNMTDVTSYIESYNAAIVSEQTPPVMTSQVSARIKNIITCINMVIERITSEYFPLTNSENLTTDSSGKILYSAASKRVYEIVKVYEESTNLRVIPYFGTDYIILPKANTSYKVFYRYLPSFINLISDSFEVSPLITVRLLSFAVVSDLLLLLNSFDEAREWNERFLSGIRMLKKIGREIRFKKNGL